MLKIYKRKYNAISIHKKYIFIFKKILEYSEFAAVTFSVISQLVIKVYLQNGNNFFHLHII